MPPAPRCSSSPTEPAAPPTSDRLTQTLTDLHTARGWTQESLRLNPGHRLRRPPNDSRPQLGHRLGAGIAPSDLAGRTAGRIHPARSRHSPLHPPTCPPTRLDCWARSPTCAKGTCGTHRAVARRPLPGPGHGPACHRSSGLNPLTRRPRQRRPAELATGRFGREHLPAGTGDVGLPRQPGGSSWSARPDLPSGRCCRVVDLFSGSSASDGRPSGVLVGAAGDRVNAHQNPVRVGLGDGVGFDALGDPVPGAASVHHCRRRS